MGPGLGDKLPGKIEELLESAARAAGNIDRPSAKSAAYTEIAGVYLQSGQKDRCLEVLSDALRTADSLKKPEEKASRLARIARVYGEAGNSSGAGELFTRAKLLARAAESPAQTAAALFDIVHEYIESGLLNEADTVISELQKMVLNPENNFDTAAELIGIAEACAAMRRTDKCADILELTLAAIPSIEDYWFRTERLVAVAELYIEIGSPGNSLRVLEKAAAAADLLDELSRPYFLIRIANLYLALNDTTRSCQVLSTALGIVNREELSFSKSEDLMEIARIYALSGNEIRARDALMQVREVLENTGDIKDQISGFIHLAGTLNSIGQSEEASATVSRAWSLCETLEDRQTRIFLLGDISLLFVELKQADKASETVGRIISLVQETHLKTSGLSVVVSDLAEAKENELALYLAGIIREPVAQASALTGIAGSLVKDRGKTDTR